MLGALAVSNYRSLRHVVLPLGRLTLVTGANGSGKSSLYRALRLLADTAGGGVIRSLAREGGLHSVLWAGPEQFSSAMQRGEQAVQGTRRREPVALRLGFASADDGLGYAIDIGLPVPSQTVFAHDPEIKHEHVWAGPLLRPAALLARRDGPLLEVRDSGARASEWLSVPRRLPPYASMLAEHVDPAGAPELVALREEVRAWRFYDHFRTDPDAPARQPQLGTRTPVLGHEGADWAAALATIGEVGDAAALHAAVADAFGGARIEVTEAGGRFEVLMHQHGLLRPLRAAELSDGTLRFLMWAAALLSPRPPPLLVLNEPETSLHPDLLPALGRLVVQASRQAQVLVVTHASRLVAAIEAERLDGGGLLNLELDKRLGETRCDVPEPFEVPAWRWAPR